MGSAYDAYGRKRFGSRTAGIGGAIVYHDELDRCIRLGEYTVDSLSQVLLAIEYRNDGGNEF
jgi:hypothetical protein